MEPTLAFSKEDDRAQALREKGAEVVVGDLLDVNSMHRAIDACEGIYFGMSVCRGIRLRRFDWAPASVRVPLVLHDGIVGEAELERLERDNLLRVLEAANWKIKGPGGAAELLGVKPTTLLSRMEKWGVEETGTRGCLSFRLDPLKAIA